MDYINSLLGKQPAQAPVQEDAGKSSEHFYAHELNLTLHLQISPTSQAHLRPLLCRYQHRLLMRWDHSLQMAPPSQYCTRRGTEYGSARNPQTFTLKRF